MERVPYSTAMSHMALAAYLGLQNFAIQNQAYSSAGLAIGTTSKKAVKIANTVTYTSGSVFKSKTTAEVPFTATTHDIAASASTVQERLYLLTLAANGTPTITAGAITTGAGTALLPELPTTGTVIGSVRIAVAAGATPFDATSDDLDAAHLTVTYTNLSSQIPKFDVDQ